MLINKLLAIFLKDFLSAISYRLGFLSQFVVPLFMIVSFFFLSRLLGETSLEGLHRYGDDYFSFVLVGIVFTTYAGIFLGTIVTILRRGQTMGTLELTLTTRTSLNTYLAGSSIYSILQGTILVALFFGLGVVVFDADFRGANLAAAVLILVLSMGIMLGLGLISGSFVLVYKQGDPLSVLVRSGAFLLSGVVYPVTVLPGWLQIGSWLLPHTYALDALRLALLQGASWSQIVPQLVALVLFGAGMLTVGSLMFKYAVYRARLDGSLAQY